MKLNYKTAREDDLVQWGVEELELRQADKEQRSPADCEHRKLLRAKNIGATLHQANMLCGDAQLFLKRKGIKV